MRSKVYTPLAGSKAMTASEKLLFAIEAKHDLPILVGSYTENNKRGKGYETDR